MANFSKVIKDHNEMRKTITQLEAVKKRIKAQQREQNPPDEFALRNNTSALGQVGFEGNQIVDDIQADSGGDASVEMVLRTLLRGIQTGLLNPSNARQLWVRIKPAVLALQANDNALLNSASLNAALLSLSNILA